MISAPIGEMTNLFGIMNAGSSGKNAVDSQNPTDTFQNIMSTVSTQNNDLASDNFYNSSTDLASKADKKQVVTNDNKDDAQNLDNNQTEYKTTDAKETESGRDIDNKKVSEKAYEVSKEIEEKVSEELDISSQELEQILENLGLSAMDLLNPQNVSLLVANVKSDGDMMSLVTEEGLSDIVLNINSDIQNLVSMAADDLSIEYDAFADIMSEMTLVSNEEGKEILASLNQDVSENVLGNSADVATIAAGEKNGILDKQLVDESEKKGLLDKQLADDSEKSIADDMDAVAATSLRESTENVGSEETSYDDSHRGKGDRSEDKAGINVAGEQNLTVNQQIGDVAFDTNTVSVSDEISHVDTQDIINQITENMKLMRSNELTEMELTLNPESLGNIHLTVATKEGNVTAQLEAQNESVRAALELQIQQIKENLEAQGVKVTAVEVTVASHSFEQNLEQGDDSNDAMDKEQEKLRKATRRLNISELLADDNIEGLDEEEAITASMMAADGNTMDYKA